MVNRPGILGAPSNPAGSCPGSAAHHHGCPLHPGLVKKTGAIACRRTPLEDRTGKPVVCDNLRCRVAAVPSRYDIGAGSGGCAGVLEWLVPGTHQVAIDHIGADINLVEDKRVVGDHSGAIDVVADEAEPEPVIPGDDGPAVDRVVLQVGEAQRCEWG